MSSYTDLGSPCHPLMLEESVAAWDCVQLAPKVENFSLDLGAVKCGRSDWLDRLVARAFCGERRLLGFWNF